MNDNMMSTKKSSGSCTPTSIIAAVVTPFSEEFDYRHDAAATSGFSDAMEKFQNVSSMATFSANDKPLIPTLDEEVGAGSQGFLSIRPSFHNDLSDGGGSQTGDDEEDVLQAASILCLMAQEDSSSSDEDGLNPKVVQMTMDILAVDPQFAALNQGCLEQLSNDRYVESTGCILETESSFKMNASLLQHPDRLAIEEDVEEVNKLHQYVRSDLLEIFVVPQVGYDGDDLDEADEEYDSNYDEQEEEEHEDPEEHLQLEGEHTTKISQPVDLFQGRVTRGSAARTRSFVDGALITSSSPAQNRHYPGRVGFRCIHCSNVRHRHQNRKQSPLTTKAAFYPLRLRNIYREVCAWQRIHFKKCPWVPREVRERYDFLKEVDTSRGKVRYWESAARKIGLDNNPHRNDGIVFTNTAWKI